VKKLFTLCLCILSFLTVTSSVTWSLTRIVPDHYPSIQDAILDCNDGDVVLIRPGTYSERINFLGKNITVTGTDPNDWDIVAATVIGGTAVGSVVTFENGETSDAVLTGLTITAGYGTADPCFPDYILWGAGIYCKQADPTITNNIIAFNHGPIIVDDAEPQAISYGGGIAAVFASPVITNNIIKNNSAAVGAGMILYIGNPVVTDNLIYANTAELGGGVVILSGRLSNNTIVNNTTAELGGVFEADRIAGNVYAVYQPPLPPTYISNNIIANAPDGGGLFFENLDPEAIAYNDLWNNLPANYVVRDPETYQFIFDGPADRTGRNGNISRDPLFADPFNNDYHLTVDSPCISAGEPDFVPAPNQTDIDGQPRIYAVRLDIGADEYYGYVDPVADAGADQHWLTAQLVTLDGSGSFFYDPCQPMLYSWTQLDGPTVTLSDPHSPTPTFLPPQSGLYRFQLTVSDGTHTSEPDTVVVMVGNQPPIADPGPDRIVTVPVRVHLDAAGSYDPDPIDPLTYSWTQIEGPNVTLHDADTVQPYFDCTQPALYVFRLVVSDPFTSSSPVDIRIAAVSLSVNSYSINPALDGFELYHYADVSAETFVYAVGSDTSDTWNIKIRDMFTDRIQVSTFDSGGIDTQPKIDGSIITWAGRASLQSPASPASTSIFAAKLPTGQKTVVQWGSDTRSYTHPAVSGNKIVYLQHHDIDPTDPDSWPDTPCDICLADMTDFNNPALLTIAENVGRRNPFPDDQFTSDFDDVIDISGNIVVWEAAGDIYGADITALDQIKIFPICTHPARQYDPAVSGNFVLWVDQRNDGADIYGADISDPAHIREIAVARAPGLQLQPAIGGPLIAYIEGSVYFGWIKAACLTRDYGVLDITLPSPAFGLAPAVDGETILWLGGPYSPPQAISLEIAYALPDGPVRNTTSGTCYDHIQHAINAAQDGDQIVVAPGTYFENINYKAKNLSLTSTAPDDPCVVSSTRIAPTGLGVTFPAGHDPNTILAGFTIAATSTAVRCYTASPHITHCTITCSAAAGIELHNLSAPHISHCTIISNTGSGILMIPYRSGRRTYYNCPTLVNCIIAANGLDGITGGIPTIDNCTITQNQRHGLFSVKPTVTNSIIYFNGPLGTAQIVSDYATVTYSDIQLSWPGLGNIDVDPCFVAVGFWDTNDTPENRFDDRWIPGDYHLRSQGWRWDPARNLWTWDRQTSRCIDAGNPAYPLVQELQTVPVDPNNLWACNLRINMGAYGRTAQASLPPHRWYHLADLTNDGHVDFEDYAALTRQPPALPALSPAGDLNADQSIDLADIALLAADWLRWSLWRR